jgi:hypothetical protein
MKPAPPVTRIMKWDSKFRNLSSIVRLIILRAESGLCPPGVDIQQELKTTQEEQG